MKQILCSGTLLTCLIAWNCANIGTAQDTGVSVPDNFVVEKFADDALATNIFCMTSNPFGDMVVSGPGYIRTLVDSDNDGVADKAIDFIDKPSGGAQGLWCEHVFYQDGNPPLLELYFVGDGGLWVVKDTDGDRQADTKPERILEIKTGGEHDAHSIQRGPDGCWYLLCGNGVPIKQKFFSGKNSPVTQPQAGFLMRISPDFSEREIVAHGFRNAYDFAFNHLGQIFTYDSDGERDVSLPWYRPTRVYKLRPGDHAGWVSAHWKRPSYFFDMPNEIGALGRGSPTGVICQITSAWGAEYQNAILVADWTFGRIVVFKYDPTTQGYDRGTPFVTASGQFGFAVTDLALGSDGSLYASVGGRGTQGGVYRIRFTGQPSRVTDQKVAWSISKQTPSADFLKEFAALDVEDHALAMHRVNQMIGWQAFPFETPEIETRYAGRLASAFDSASLHDLGPLIYLLRGLPQTSSEKTLKAINTKPLANCINALLESEANPDAALNSLCVCLESLPSMLDKNRIVGIRCAQLVLGGSGKSDGPPMFHGYQAIRPVALDSPESSTRWVDSWMRAFEMAKTKPEKVELGRLAAMLSLDSKDVYQRLVGQLGLSGDAIDDIHWLICISLLETRATTSESKPIANTVVRLRREMAEQDLQIDRNWMPRMQSLIKRLTESEFVAMQILQHPEFGQANHDFIYNAMPRQWRGLAAQRFQQKFDVDDESITPSQLRIVTSSRANEWKPVLRQLVDRTGLKDSVIQILTRQPVEEDRQAFIQGLSSNDRRTISNCAIALRQIEIEATPVELARALRAAGRLGWDKKENSVRDQIVRFLQQQTGRNYGYQFRDDKRQETVIQSWHEDLAGRFPVEYKSVFKTTASTANLNARITGIDWDGGDLARGKRLYSELQCAKCHDAGSRLGPQLNGITQRFSKVDLFRSIVDPHEQVPERYQALILMTTDGLIYKGTMIYESVDGITLMEDSGETIRINRANIDSRQQSTKSLMPTGLLDQADDQAWADLYTYLKSF